MARRAVMLFTMGMSAGVAVERIQDVQDALPVDGPVTAGTPDGRAGDDAALTLRVLDPKDKTKVLATREKSVDVKAKGGAEVAFDVFTIPNILNATFELTGSAGEQKDCLELTVPVQPWGLPYVAHAGGTANTDTAAVLRLTAPLQPKSATV